jgi:VCBS repeat-containing protein
MGTPPRGDIAAAVNNVAVISGDSTATVTEDGVTTAGGKLTIVDGDVGEDAFLYTKESALAGTYGTFTFNPTTGEWTYALNNSSSVVQALTSASVATDTLVVSSVDGSATKTIVVTINGADEVVVTPPTAPTNAAPTISVENLDQTTQSGTPITITIGDGHFTDADGDDLTYTITVDGSATLPDWITFDADTGLFVANPTSSHAGNHLITVTANDGTLSSGTDEFNLVVTNAAAPQNIRGTRRDDVLKGGAGDDTIFGRKGDDTLVGHDGADTFVFSKGHDKVRDFDASEGDTIDLAKAKGIESYHDLIKHHIVDTDAGIKIVDEAGSWMLVKGLHEADLTKDMFQF